MTLIPSIHRIHPNEYMYSRDKMSAILLVDTPLFFRTKSTLRNSFDGQTFSKSHTVDRILVSRFNKRGSQRRSKVKSIFTTETIGIMSDKGFKSLSLSGFLHLIFFNQDNIQKKAAIGMLRISDVIVSRWSYVPQSLGLCWNAAQFSGNPCVRSNPTQEKGARSNDPKSLHPGVHSSWHAYPMSQSTSLVCKNPFPWWTTYFNHIFSEFLNKCQIEYRTHGFTLPPKPAASLEFGGSVEHPRTHHAPSLPRVFTGFAYPRAPCPS